MRVALVHYWAFGMRGGERVLEAFCRRFPDADIFMHVADERQLSSTITRHRLRRTFISRLPFANRYYQRYLPLMPLALEMLDLSDYDLVVSFEAGPAKGVIVRPDALHLCYAHSPMRYIWDQFFVYRQTAGRLTRVLMGPIAHYLRIWDVTSAARVDHFVANSKFVARRVLKYYRREADGMRLLASHFRVGTMRWSGQDRLSFIMGESAIWHSDRGWSPNAEGVLHGKRRLGATKRKDR